jgi:hypothetical protein
MTDVKDVLEERANTHGDFSFVATVAQELKHTLRLAGYASLEPWQTEALDMIVSKIGRIVAGNADEPDHWLDIEGYARLARERIKTDG